MIRHIGFTRSALGTTVPALALIATLAVLAIAPAPALADPAADYAEFCAECHGPGRLGAQGPAMIPETLKRMRGPKMAAVIREGRPATQMAGYGDILDEARIAALVTFLETPLAVVPDWGEAEITASRVMDADYRAVEAPVWAADPMNITLVVETGDHHVSVLDGDTFEVLDRFATPFAVHGGPKFTPDGRYVFIMSRDGWVQKYDIWALQQVGRVRAGINSRNIAMSHDGKWLAVANYLPNSLTILSTDDLSVAKVIEVKGRDGTPSRVSAVYQAPPRKSFVLALKDVPEIWRCFMATTRPIRVSCMIIASKARPIWRFRFRCGASPPPTFWTISFSTSPMNMSWGPRGPMTAVR